MNSQFIEQNKSAEKIESDIDNTKRYVDSICDGTLLDTTNSQAMFKCAFQSVNTVITIIAKNIDDYLSDYTSYTVPIKNIGCLKSLEEKLHLKVINNFDRISSTYLSSMKTRFKAHRTYTRYYKAYHEI